MLGNLGVGDKVNFIRGGINATPNELNAIIDFSQKMFHATNGFSHYIL